MDRIFASEASLKQYGEAAALFAQRVADQTDKLAKALTVRGESDAAYAELCEAAQNYAKEATALAESASAGIAARLAVLAEYRSADIG